MAMVHFSGYNGMETRELGNGDGWRWVGRGERSELYAWVVLEKCINAVEGRKWCGWYTSIVGVS